jgi:hypothetical protein
VSAQSGGHHVHCADPHGVVGLVQDQLRPLAEGRLHIYPPDPALEDSPTMPMHRRYGLRTVALSGPRATGRRQIDHVLEGRKTVVLRPLLNPDGSTDALERPGELLMALDPAGRSVAVLRVERAGIAALADVEEAMRRADDPDADGHAAWVRSRRQEWLAAGHPLGGNPQVVWIRFHVVGRNDPEKDGES